MDTTLGPVELLTILVLVVGLYYQRRAVHLQHQQVESELADLQEVVTRLDSETREREAIAKRLEATYVDQLNGDAGALTFTSQMAQIHGKTISAAEQSRDRELRFVVAQLAKLAAACRDGTREQVEEVAEACAGYSEYLLGAQHATEQYSLIVDAANDRFAEAIADAHQYGLTAARRETVELRLKELKTEINRANSDLETTLNRLSGRSEVAAHHGSQPSVPLLESRAAKEK